MIRRPLLHLIAAPLALSAIAACSDPTQPTAAAPTATQPQRPVAAIVPTPAADVTYGLPEATFRVYDTKIESVSDGEFSGISATVKPGSKISLAAKWQLGTVTGCPFFDCETVLMAWGPNAAENGATPVYRSLTRFIRSDLTGEFAGWETQAPTTPGDYWIGVAHGATAAPIGELGWPTGGDPTFPDRASFKITVVSSAAPTITPKLSGTLGSLGWYTSDVSLTWDVIEGTLPVTTKTGCSPVTISVDTDGTTYMCSAASDGGSTSKSVTIKRDATKPTITTIAEPAANAAGWNSTEVVVSAKCDDDTSPVVKGTEATVSGDGANQSATVECSDDAGNTVTATRSGINIDMTAPALAPSVSPNPVAFKSAATASPNASDERSGIASASCGAAVTSLAGTFSVNCTATDKAGNTATQSAPYTVTGYSFGGFLAPVSAPPTLNSKNAGSAVLVKFSLGGNKGLTILAAGSPTSRPITCPLGATVNTVAEAATSSSGNSGLTYDATTNQYTYTWKTDKSWAGTCRMLLVKLADGTEHPANFQFKK